MDLVMAVSVYGELSQEAPRSVFDILYRTFEVMAKRANSLQAGKADYVIAPKVGKVGTGQFYRAEECIEQGELAAREALPEIKKIIEEFQARNKEQAALGCLLKRVMTPLLERLTWKLMVFILIALVVVQLLLVVPGVRYQLSVVEGLRANLWAESLITGKSVWASDSFLGSKKLLTNK